MAFQRRQAFTLIELLIVISIIAILFSIGLPAIVKASSLAREAKCLSNVRSMMQATTAYTTDFRQVYPGVGTTNAGGTPGTTATNQVRMINLVGQPGVSASTIYAVPAADRPLFDYLNGQTLVAECPLDQGSSMAPATIASSNYEYLGSSYAYPDRIAYTRVYGRHDIWSLEGHKLTEVQQPSKKLVIADNVFFVDGVAERDQWHGQVDGAQAATVGFVDGHVAVTGAKTPVPTNVWSQYLFGNGLVVTTTDLIESWATVDPYY